MIKIVRILFKKLEDFKPIIDFERFGEPIGYQEGFFKDYRECGVVLDTNTIYDLSMDQSSSNTGIFIKSEDNTEVYMIEVLRNKSQDAHDYIFDLEMFISKLVGETHIAHTIYEKPIKSESYRSSQVLFALEGNIKALCKRYEAFKCSRLENIENPAWRAQMIQDEFASLSRKESSLMSVRALFPWTAVYGNSLYKDNDIYESIGIMFGWFKSAFDHLGRPYVRGDQFFGSIGVFLLPEIDAEELAKGFEEQGLKSNWAVYNPSFSTFKNIVKQATAYEVSCVQVEDPYVMLMLCVEANMVYTKYSKMTMVLVTPNYIDRRIYDITGKEFSFVL